MNYFTKEDMEEIVGIQFGTKIYFGKEAIKMVKVIGTFTNLHPRATFKFMAMFDLDPKFREYAMYPTIFTMQQFRDFEAFNAQ